MGERLLGPFHFVEPAHVGRTISITDAFPAKAGIHGERQYGTGFTAIAGRVTRVHDDSRAAGKPLAAQCQNIAASCLAARIRSRISFRAFFSLPGFAAMNVPGSSGTAPD